MCKIIFPLCGRCHNPLTGYTIDERLYINPCKHCAGDMYWQGVDDGRVEGYFAGHADGVADEEEITSLFQ